MRSLPTILLALLALALSGLAVMQVRHGNLDLVFGTPPLERGEVLYKFQAKEVARISLKNHGGKEIVLIKKNGQWRTTKPWHDLADTRMVRTLIDFSRTLLIEDIRKPNSFDASEQAGLGSDAIEIALHDADSRPLVSYSLGKHTPWRSFDPESGDSYPTVFVEPNEKKLAGHYYVCADIPDPKVRPTGIRTLLRGNFDLFRDHRAFNLSPSAAAEVRLGTENSELLLQRDRLDPKAWKMKRPLQLATNPETVEKLLQGLTALSARRVLDSDQVNLPAPEPENLARRISLRFFQRDGSISDPPTELQIYPPEKADSPVVYARVSGRDAILTLPRKGANSLAALPTGVNKLRSQTLTSLTPADFKSLRLTGKDGRRVRLELVWNPHERAKRWMADAGRADHSYQGPANEAQVATLFTALCKTPVAEFADDAATDLEKYGLDEPRFTLRISLNEREEKKPAKESEKAGENSETWTYQFSQKSRPHYYATLPGSSRIVELKEKNYRQARKGKVTQLLPQLSSPLPPGSPKPYLAAYGLDPDQAEKISLPDQQGQLLLGKISQPHDFAHRNGTARVVEITPDTVDKIAALSPWQWKQLRPWSLVAFEIRGLDIRRPGRPDLQLSYQFFKQNWQATLGGKDQTAHLNTNRANHFLEFLETLEVHSWLGPKAPQAAQRLQTPNLTLTIFTEELAPDGTKGQLKPLTLKVAQVQPGVENKLFYASLSTTEDYFLLGLPTVQRLAENFFE